jgi:hypothetical protein
MQKIRIGCFAVIVCIGIAGYFLSSSVDSMVMLFCFIPVIAFLSFIGFVFTDVTQLNEVSRRDVPKSLQESHEALLALGFEPFGSMQVRELNISHIVWAYLSEDGYTHAYIGGIKGGTWFSSYFGQTLDVTTRYQNGIHISNGKAKEKVVRSSLEATLDYHLHRVENYANQWGNPIIFASLQEQIDWEQQYKTQEAISLVKGVLWGIARFGLGIVITMLIYWLVIFPNEAISPDVKVLMCMPAPLAPLIFAALPLFRSRTAEARKKKKMDEKEKPLA